MSSVRKEKLNSDVVSIAADDPKNVNAKKRSGFKFQQSIKSQSELQSFLFVKKC